MAVQPPRPFRLDQAHVHGVTVGAGGRRAPADLLVPRSAVHRTQAQQDPRAHLRRQARTVRAQWLRYLEPQHEPPVDEEQEVVGTLGCGVLGGVLQAPSRPPRPNSRRYSWISSFAAVAAPRSWHGRESMDAGPLGIPESWFDTFRCSFLTISSCCRRSNTSGKTRAEPTVPWIQPEWSGPASGSRDS